MIFSGENGIDTTEKLKELILKTSATSIPVKFVAYDYYRLMKNGSHDEIFQQYHVKCIMDFSIRRSREFLLSHWRTLFP